MTAKTFLLLAAALFLCLIPQTTSARTTSPAIVVGYQAREMWWKGADGRNIFREATITFPLMVTNIEEETQFRTGTALPFDGMTIEGLPWAVSTSAALVVNEPRYGLPDGVLEGSLNISLLGGAVLPGEAWDLCLTVYVDVPDYGLYPVRNCLTLESPGWVLDIGGQIGTLEAGAAGTVQFPVRLSDLGDGFYSLDSGTWLNTTRGITWQDYILIDGGEGVLHISSDGTREAASEIPFWKGITARTADAVYMAVGRSVLEFSHAPAAPTERTGGLNVHGGSGRNSNRLVFPNSADRLLAAAPSRFVNASAAAWQMGDVIEIIAANYAGGVVYVHELTEAAFLGMTALLYSHGIEADLQSAEISRFFDAIALTEAAAFPLPAGVRSEVAAQRLEGMLDVLISRYAGEAVSAHELMEAALRAMTELLDRHSIYFSAEELAGFADSIDGRLFGIGVSLVMREDGRMVVARVLPDAPAQRAGILPGDVLVSVDGSDVFGMPPDVIVGLIVDPRYESVVVEFERGGRTLIFDIVKEEVQSPTVIVERPRGMPRAYRLVQVTSMSLATGNDFRTAMERMREEGVRGIILDLRGNTGGSLDVTVDIANQIVPRGVVLQMVGQAGDRRTYSSGLREAPFENIVVLVDRFTASAAEVIASALQDSGAALVVGEVTFGKGLVQSIFPLREGGAVRLTTEEYFRRDGRGIEGVGVVPCVVLEDAGLEWAVEALLWD